MTYNFTLLPLICHFFPQFKISRFILMISRFILMILFFMISRFFFKDFTFYFEDFTFYFKNFTFFRISRFYFFDYLILFSTIPVNALKTGPLPDLIRSPVSWKFRLYDVILWKMISNYTETSIKNYQFFKFIYTINWILSTLSTYLI